MSSGYPATQYFNNVLWGGHQVVHPNMGGMARTQDGIFLKM